MKMHSKEKAIKLRKAGWSYNIIQERLGVSKSTLSNWLKWLAYVPNDEVRKRIKEGPLKSVIARSERKVRSIRDTKFATAKELGKLTNRDLWMMGLGLYMGEGSKTHENIRVINSDPNIIKVAISWFRYSCGILD